MRLLQSATSGASLGNTLTAGEIYKIQTARLMRTISVLLFVAYDKDGVRARAPIVLIGRSDGSAALTVHQGHEDIIESLDSLDLAAHDHHLPVGHLSQFEVLFLVADSS